MQFKKYSYCINNLTSDIEYSSIPIFYINKLLTTSQIYTSTPHRSYVYVNYYETTLRTKI